MWFNSFLYVKTILMLGNSDFFLILNGKYSSISCHNYISKKHKIMTDNKQMIVDRESGESGDQPQQAPNTGETSELQQRPQVVSANYVNFTIF